MKTTFRSTFALFAAAICIAVANLSAEAFTTSSYAKKSAMSTGRWVKIEVTESGMYEITFDQLREMGFSNPSAVKVFGMGGPLISEILNGNVPDDMTPVYIGKNDSKIYFYAQGPVKFSYSASTAPHYQRTINHYSNSAYYFLTDSGLNYNIPTNNNNPLAGSNVRYTSFNYYYSESEQVSLSGYGRDLVGFPVASSGLYTAPVFNLTNYSPGTALTVQAAVAAKTTSSTTAKVAASINGSNVTFSGGTLNALTDFDNYVKSAPIGTVSASNVSNYVNLKVGVDNISNVSSAYLDYFIITYVQDNEYPDDQFKLLFNDLTSSDRIAITMFPETGEVWTLADPQKPRRLTLGRQLVDEGDPDDEEDDIYETYFVPSQGTSKLGEFIAFDPTCTLKQIKSYEVVENQNLHGLSTPDMVIITSTPLLEEAQRLADFRKEHSGLDVIVVDQTKIFNEFSSGTPDGTAYRLFLKMLYDRNPSKLKYLLLFGPGFFDNRQITTQKGDSYLLTYQSDNSSNWLSAFVSDDYFVILDDNTGSTITRDKISLGVGRITAITPQEAHTVVDKIINYETLDDYTDWRNVTTIMADRRSADGDIHLSQGVKIANMIESTIGNKQNIKRYYTETYPTSPSGKYEMGKEHLSTIFNEGSQIFCYIGHGSNVSFASLSIWKIEDVRKTLLPRLPIMVIAACDMAKYDTNTRGIGELMSLIDNRGAVAILTSTRTVESSENYALVNEFFKALYTPDSNGVFPTLGEAYRTAKLAYGSASRNKMCYTLFGDPSIRPHLALPTAVVDEVNGVECSSTQPIELKPMTNIDVSGHINNIQGTIDSDFNGTATVAIYGKLPYFKTIDQDDEILDVYLDRQLLAKIDVPVVNGSYNASILLPSNCDDSNADARILVYAHNDDNTKFHNGDYTNLVITPFDPETAIVDEQMPVIESMYFNDEQAFAKSTVVSNNATFKAVVTDDLALCTQDTNIGATTRLSLDNGTTNYNGINGFTTLANDGKTLNISMPIIGLTPGDHNITLSISDAAGNITRKTIAFAVIDSNNSFECDIKAKESTVCDKAEFEFSHAITDTPVVAVKILDAANNIVAEINPDDLSNIQWDLNDSNGQCVAPGIYYFYATAVAGVQHGGTPIHTIAVVDK